MRQGAVKLPLKPGRDWEPGRSWAGWFQAGRALRWMLRGINPALAGRLVK